VQCRALLVDAALGEFINVRNHTKPVDATRASRIPRPQRSIPSPHPPTLARLDSILLLQPVNLASKRPPLSLAAFPVCGSRTIIILPVEQQQQQQSPEPSTPGGSTKPTATASPTAAAPKIEGMAEPIPPVELEEEIDYESLGGGSLTSNLLAGAFAGIMVCDVVGVLAGRCGLLTGVSRSTR
jgi:hypothetical protein